MTHAADDAPLPGLTLYRRGKVRDTYQVEDRHLLMVASDRISAFDVVLPTSIPFKGVVLTQLSRFWFEMTSGLVPNHRETDAAVKDRVGDALTMTLGGSTNDLAGRTMLVRKAERIDIECVVRGYLAGSAWAEYRAYGTVAGEPLPTGLDLAARLPAPMFTPAAKRDDGHDVNITRQELVALIGEDMALRLEGASRDLYGVAHDYALGRGILLADTKFEFGLVDGELTLIDELLTPDSSRFWDAATYAPGRDQPSFDKQYARDWLTDSGWDREPPGPELPPDVVSGTVARYREAYQRLVGFPLSAVSTVPLLS